jgi:hypothetical protein
MDNMVDIRDLGKREKEIKIYDPYAESDENRKYTVLRLIKMSPGESRDCFKFSQDAYQKELQITQDNEKENKTFDTIINSMSLKDCIDQLVALKRADMESMSDLVEVQGADKLSDEEIEIKQKEKILQWTEDERKRLEKEKEEDIRGKVKELLLETPAINAQNRAFAEKALAYMCYAKNEDKRLFNPDPESDNYITKVIRDELIFAQLHAAYGEFTKTYRISAKEMRKLTMRGGDFFISTKSASDTEKSRSTMN